MPYDKQMRLHDHHEYEEESPMLRDHLSNDGLVVSEEASWTKRNPGNSMARFRYGLLFICATVIVVSLSFFLGIQFDTHGFDRRCMKHASMYSPVLREMDPQWTFVQFNGTLGHQTEWTGDPSPEVDAVWQKWAYVKYASIPETTFEKLYNADPESARLTPEYGGGYIGFLEVSHHLHCLNLLRMGVHRDYYMQEAHKPAIFRDRPWTIKLHFEHCIEMLRQNIMCNADVGIIPHHWIRQSPDPFANFNTWHKCRDIGSVERWIEEHTIPDVPNGGSLPRPEGDKVWPEPP